MGGYLNKGGKIIGGLPGGSSGSGVETDMNTAAGLGSSTDSLTGFPAIGATSGIGIMKRTTSMALKVELTALEAKGTVSYTHLTLPTTPNV